MRIVTVIGNRPQFVKAAAVSRLLRERHEELIIHTGQHYDDELSRIFFEELGVPAPARQLGVGGGSLTSQTARMLAQLEPELYELRPDMVLVYGDTNSTLAGALAAAQRHVPVAHVEAGMRSFDRRMPEELNRVLTDHASDLLLCSTETAVANLRSEATTGEVVLVGDAMADVTLAFAPVAEKRSTALADHGVDPGEYLVVTAHRAGNVDDPARLERLVELLEALPLPAVFPLHPRTRARPQAPGLLPPAGAAPPPAVLPPPPRCARAPGGGGPPPGGGGAPTPPRGAAPRLPRLPAARPPRPRRAHRLGRRPEGGVPARHALRDPARHDR